MDSDHKLSCDKQRSKSCEVKKKKKTMGKVAELEGQTDREMNRHEMFDNLGH